MFANFLYFLFALVIYTSVELFDTAQVVKTDIVVYAIILSLLFLLICQVTFKRLVLKSRYEAFEKLDHLTHIHMNRLSILALLVFAIIVHGLHFNSLFSEILIFETIPTLRALFCLSLFFLYLIMVWWTAYPVRKRYYPAQISRVSFILSNISFSLPALLPWFAISFFADLLVFLPWPPLKEFFQTTGGEALYIGIFLVIIAIFGPVFIKKLWNCRSLEHGQTRDRIEHVCKKAGLQYSDILKWELFGGAMITAGIMGLIGRFRYILVTPALLRALNEEELEAVVMHEIGHVQRYHMLFYLFFFIGFVACNYVFFEPVLMLLYIFEPAYYISGLVGIEKETAHPVLFVMLLLAFFASYFRFGFGFFMRNFERQADLHIYNFTTNASPLISTFFKIASYSRQSMEKPNWHHYSIGERVRFLERCQKYPDLIQAHHGKVRKMIAGFMLLVITVFVFGYSINYGSAQKVFENYIAEKILFQKLEIEPDNTELYTLVGDYFYEKKNYQKAIESYENVLLVDSENVYALNNLSWLYATCPDQTYRDKKKALEYSKKAVSLKKEDYILDTYAEALFFNDDIEGAVVAAREAVSLSQGKGEYFKKQLRRFEELLYTKKL